MLHICDINNFFSFTGGGVRTYHLNKIAFFANRPETTYTLFMPDDHFIVEHEAPNVNLVHFPAVAIPGAANYRYIIDARRLRETLNDLAPDIIEVGSPYIAPWIVRWAAADLDARIIGFWHADYPRAYIERPLANLHPTAGALGKQLAWWYAQQTYGQYDATFAAADCVVQGLWEHHIPRVFQTPLGVDIERFHPRNRSEALRERVGATGDRPLLFFPHRLLEEKGLSQLLAAWPRIYAKHEPVLAFAGVGPGKPKLDAFMAKQPDVHYLGFLTDPEEMATWYASADAIFALSAFETFGLSAAEAMASGTALIGANAGAVEEWVRRSSCGRLVPYGDVDALVEATCAILDGEEIERAGRNARRFAERHFSWESAFERMLRYYEELARTPDVKALSPEPRRWIPSPGS